ncbi:TetR/AcrR family transcriptional regulator [Rhizobium sp. CG5]|uniref:TetR family transcriptional regulator n=1 Tax=Rhizobium sp. CG5 TaxID=2726076 RepID=UPI00203346EC|nr:TetR family transcriptional regulator [Rhizobium sp. CG5]MCM2475947.1 TetR/AcrR family transcriptional regulator [Rhizobium sp. CG5]
MAIGCGEKAPSPSDGGSVRRPRRKAEETREDILNIAESLFRARGYSSVAIADIAAALGMSPANVFKHFHTKTSLIDAISSRHIESLAHRLARPDPGKAPPERLLCMVEQLMESHLRDLKDNPHVFEMILLTTRQELECGLHYRAMVAADIASIIEDGMRQGIYHVEDSLRSAHTAAMALSCVLHPVMIANEKPDILATRCREVVDLINAALQNPLVR